MHEDKDTGEDLESESYADYETVVKDICIDLHSNEKVALIGKVGSGKSSLFLTILRELSLVKGTIAYNPS